MTFFVEALTRLHDAEAQVRHIGEFETQDEAFAASKRTIDEFLLREYKAGMSADKLFSLYQKFGEVPFIFGDANHTMSVRGFNHMQYAQARCAEICAGT